MNLQFFSVIGLVKQALKFKFKFNQLNLNQLNQYANWHWRIGRQIAFGCLVMVLCLSLNPAPAFAGLTDDRFDGNIFPLYAGNGSLAPAKVTLAEAFTRKRPALLFFYVDDSSDCKAFSQTISRLHGFYGWAADFIPVSIDRIPLKDHYEPTEPGYYYKGYVPQTVLFDQSGKVVLDAKGSVAYEQIDDVLRQVFDLLPRSESVELRRRTVNEAMSEVVEQKVQPQK
jgi:hypothetical protein